MFPDPWVDVPIMACKRKEQEPNKDRNNSQKKSRLVFTDLQRRTLFAIFKENKRPSKEMQITISQQLGLELTTYAPHKAKPTAKFGSSAEENEDEETMVGTQQSAVQNIGNHQQTAERCMCVCQRKTKITQTIKMSESKITPELVNIYNYDYKIIS
ncbi:Homeodomain-related containing protein [Cricetulus griseus]|nr:Homeodomain-related containing protein [Cricetulus griseus]